MSRIPDELVEQVRDAVDLVGLVGEAVDLKRTGSDWRGACPFHGGTHRNFVVVPRKNLYHCYVCHESGDAFTYLMKRFGMDYPTAVRDAARRAGIDIPERTERDAGPDPREPLFTAAAAAHDWFVRRLAEAADAEPAREYLASRGISLETAGELGLGFAPRGPGFREHLRGLGIDEEVALQAGLLHRRTDGSIVPRFRGRLLFPIHDLRGRVVAFGGRILGEGEPKYLNSPETEIFYKGRTLYHLHEAKQAIRREGQALLVEGYFDVVRLSLAGIEHAVAPLGTGLTDDQASLLRRYTGTVILLYDSDSAGLRATFRAGDVLLRHRIEVRVGTLPEGEDPDSLVRAGGAAALQPVLRDAIDVLERKLQLLERKDWFADVAHRRAALDKLLPTLRAAADPITRDLYLTRVHERTGVGVETLRSELASRPEPPREVGPQGRQDRAATAPAPRPVRRDSEEWLLLVALFTNPHWRATARAEIPETLFEDPVLREVYRLAIGTGEPPMLTPDAPDEVVAAYGELSRLAGEVGDAQADQMYADTLSALLARPLWREYEAVVAAQRVAVPPEDTELALQERRLRAELERRFPLAWKRRGTGHQFHKSGPRGRTSSPRRRTDAP